MDLLVHRILDFLNTSCWQNLVVCFGRVNKTNQRFYATYVKASYRATKRRGGGFLIWLKYNDQVMDHRLTARTMLQDYQAKYKKVKTKVINPSLDLLFVINGKMVPFKNVFPFCIRELKCDIAYINKWQQTWETILGWVNILHLEKPLPRKIFLKRSNQNLTWNPSPRSSGRS